MKKNKEKSKLKISLIKLLDKLIKSSLLDGII